MCCADVIELVLSSTVAITCNYNIIVLSQQPNTLVTKAVVISD